MESLARAVIQEAQTRFSHLPAQVRACLQELSEEQLWWRPNATSNSVANLVLHVVGSTHHFLGCAVGGSDYRRHRKAEFSELGPLPRAELLRRLEECVEESRSVLAALDPARLTEVSDRGGEPQTLLGLILRTTHHWAVHTGQIVYVTKTLREGCLDDLWIKTLPR